MKDINEIWHPEAIEAVRGLARNYEVLASQARADGDPGKDEEFTQIASSLESMANDAAHQRSMFAGRRILNTSPHGLLHVTEEQQRTLVAAIDWNGEKLKQAVSAEGPGHTVRLARYLDPFDGSERWATMLWTGGLDRMIIDFGSAGDAEVQWRELLDLTGAVEPVG